MMSVMLNWKLVRHAGRMSLFGLIAALTLCAGAFPAAGQACPAQSWSNPTPNIWAAGSGIKVMLNNDPTTNRPTIPTYDFDGNFNPWGYQQHPQAITQLNDVWSCPSGSPVIAVAGAGRETISFQLFISASSGSALSSVSVAVSPLTGAGTLTSDTTGTSNVTEYLEGYVPYSGLNATIPSRLQANGEMPDPLIPFYDPYDPGNPAVATPFNVQAGTTQGVWVNIAIPVNQTAGSYTGTVTVSGSGIATTTIPLNVTVWNGNLPAFDAGSVDPTYADMLKSWLPFYRSNFDHGEGMTCGGPGCATEQALYQKYQVMGHNYDVDVQMDADYPSNSGCYPSGACTSYTTDGTTSSLNWTAYDNYVGPALTPGALFSDGTAMRVFDSPLSTAGSGAWKGGGYSWHDDNFYGFSGSLPPAGMIQLFGNYATQISQHFAANHINKGWAIPELIAYDYDETDNAGKAQLGRDSIIYQNISLFNQAINQSNTALSPTWAAATAPIHTFLTDMPACAEAGDYSYYTDSACADHINLSYPGGTNATPGYTDSWVTAWSPNPAIFMPGRPGPAFHSGDTLTPTIIANTGYQYTFDLTDGVPALSTAPVPIERWFYQGGDPFSSQESIYGSGIGQRINYWIAYKYGLDVTVPSAGDPNPATPAPGGVWVWVGDYWGPYGDIGSSSTPSNCTSPAQSPFVSAPVDGSHYSGNGVLFYPGNEIGCYYTANPVGEAVLTASPAVNTGCTSHGYSVCNGISGPVASMGLEQMRRGYEDYEYMYLLGKKSGRAAPLAIINSLGAAGMTEGGQGTTSWNALDWSNATGPWYIMGVEPESSAYTGYCTDSTPGIGGLPGGLPNGPTGAASTGPDFNYNPCPGEWTNNPYRFEAARVQLAEALGFASASTAPSVIALSPSSGTNQGGDTVTISGTNFTGTTEVDFGGISASFTVNSATQITAITPAENGTVDVQVFGPGGGSTPSDADLFTFVSPVTVTGLSPSQGVAAGGTTVNITGTDFAPGAIVMFGNAQATSVVVNSATSITATAPAGVNIVDVTVTTSQGTSAANSADRYTYLQAPTVTGVSPSSGPIAGGTLVTISGTSFVSGTTVQFGTNAATNVVVNSTTSLTATSPAGSSMSGGAVDVTVTTPNGTSPTNGTDRFTYVSPVTVTGLSVNNGPPGGGTQVVITGTGFTGATAVNFGGNAASFTVNSATQITATSPAGGGTVDVTVTTPPYGSTVTRADEFFYTSAVSGAVFATLPTTSVGSVSTVQNIQITLQSATALSSVTVPPAQNGAQEFTVGTVTGCSLGGAVNPANTVCTVPITFKPQYPGIRTGTLTLNNAGAVIGTAGLAGVGLGPEVAISPGGLALAVGGGAAGVTAAPQSVTTAALSVSNNGSALAIDGAGNLYIADNINCLAYKVTAADNKIVAIAGDYTFSGNGTIPTTTPEPALGSATCPQAIAVDPAGNVYIVDAHANGSDGYPNVVEEISAATGQIFVMAGGGTTKPTPTPQAATSVLLDAVNSLATDMQGNLYIADFYNNLIEKVNPAGQIAVVVGNGGRTPAVSTTPQSGIGVALNGPTGMVIDSSGNLFFSDQTSQKVDELNAAGQVFTIAGGGTNAPAIIPQAALTVALSNPAGLALDPAGNLYIGDFSNQMVEQLSPAGKLAVVTGGGAIAPGGTPIAATSASLGLLQGIEVDGAGNLYIADGRDIGNGDNMIEKVSPGGIALSFANTDVGSSSAPQSLALANIGNQTLNIASVSTTTDFPLQSTGTCTVTATTGQTLASATSCSLSYLFQPTAGGLLNESATLSDNSLNTANAQQALLLSGTGIGQAPQLTGISPSSGTAGTVVTLTGSNLNGATAVHFGTNAVTPNSSTSTTVTAAAPAGSGTVNVTVTTSSGTSNSEQFTYVSLVTATPTFSAAAGTYSSAQVVAISDATPGAAIYYTTDGSTPTTSSSTYNSPIIVSASETIQAIAVASGYQQSATGSAAFVITGSSSPVLALTPGSISTLAGVQGATTSPTDGMVASGNSVGAPVGIAVAPVIGGAGGDIYFDNCGTTYNCSFNYRLYVLYEGGAAAKAMLVARGISSPVIGDTYLLHTPNETGPASLSGIAVDSYGNVLVADWGYDRVYLYYAGTITGQGPNPADALLTADGNVATYGLHAGYVYHVADGSHVVGSAPTQPTPRGVYVDSAENIFFTDYGSNDVELVYNAPGTSAATILAAEGYTNLKQGYTYIIAGGQSVTTYPNDNDGGGAAAYNGGAGTATTATHGPFSIYGDAAGNIYFTDRLSNKIKKLSATTAVLSTVGGPAAGTATTTGHAGDGGLATSSQMNLPDGLVVDKGGAIYFADSANGAIRKIDTNGYISTVAGVNGTSGTYSGEGGNATAAILSNPYMLAIDPSGSLYLADEGNDLIHKVVMNAAAAATVIVAPVNNSGNFTYEGSFSFGNQAINSSSAPATALISNITGSPVTLNEIYIPSGYVQVSLGNSDAPDCTTTTPIAAGRSCTLALEFSPAATGTYNANAVVITGAQVLTIALTGTGMGTASLPELGPPGGAFSLAMTPETSSGGVAANTGADSVRSGFSIAYAGPWTNFEIEAGKVTTPGPASVVISVEEDVKGLAAQSHENRDKCWKSGPLLES